MSRSASIRGKTDHRTCTRILQFGRTTQSCVDSGSRSGRMICYASSLVEEEQGQPRYGAGQFRRSTDKEFPWILLRKCFGASRTSVQEEGCPLLEWSCRFGYGPLSQSRDSMALEFVLGILFHILLLSIIISCQTHALESHLQMFHWWDSIPIIQSHVSLISSSQFFPFPTIRNLCH